MSEQQHAPDSQLPSQKIPSLTLHKPSGRGYVRLNGQVIYLGRYGDPETTEKYRRTIAEWLVAGQQLPADPQSILVSEVAARFLLHAKTYYTKPNGKTSCEYANMVQAIRPMTELYGRLRAVEFGPLALKAVRQKMVEHGFCRSNINKMVGRLKTIFRWATENELIPGNVYHALVSVAGLKRGRCNVKETMPVRPAAMELVEAVRPFVSEQVWAMIQLQLLTAARSGELCVMRKGDIDRSGEVWIYQPAEHKTAHHGHGRKIFIGPQAQKHLLPFLLRPDDAFVFSPQDAMRAWLARKSQERVTPLNQGNRPGTNKRDDPDRTAGDHYTPESYARAISRALELAFPPPEPLAKRDDETHTKWQARLTAEDKANIKAWHKKHHWHPHQLRHNAATEIRKQFGLEAARIILGHRSSAITEVYAELDQQKAIDAMKKIG